MTVSYQTANEAWVALLSDLVQRGTREPSRNGEARELLGYQSSFAMRYPVVTAPARGLGYRFQAAEAAWILSGSNRLDEIAPYARRMAEFSDDGQTLAGAYGPPVVDQLPYVVCALASDPTTRQAVLTIWRPSPGPSRDVPCTLALQFLVCEAGGPKLHLAVTMRLSDAWLGWPCDVFTFTMIAATVLLRLRGLKPHKLREHVRVFRDLTLGTLTLTAGSQHLYEANYADVEALLAGTATSNGPGVAPFEPERLFKSDRTLLKHLAALAEGRASPHGWRAEV